MVKLSRHALFLTVVSASPLARAAEITDVADAVDVIELGDVNREDPFDAYLGPDLIFEWGSGKITREPIDYAGVVSPTCSEANARLCLPVDELKYKSTNHRMKIHGEIGMFHDLALLIAMPIVFHQSTSFSYAKGVGANNSTVDPDPAFGRPALFPNTFTSYHSGPGELELGLRWAALNDERDATKPSWLLTVTWAMPWTAKTFNPTTQPATKDKNGSVGDGVHRLTFTTALSKRVANFGLIGIDEKVHRRGYTEPYMEFVYTLPLPSDKALAPLRHDNRTLAPTEDPNKVPNRFGNLPSHEAHLNFGFEIVPYEDVLNERKVSFDLGVRSGFFSEGRNYSILSDALQELTFTEQYFSIGGFVGINAQAAPFLRIRAGFGFGTITEHFVTFENVGKDGSGDGQVRQDEPQDVLNPYFACNDPNDRCNALGVESYDQVGFRFKQQEHIYLQAHASVWLTF